MDSDNTVEFVTVEEAMQAMSEIMRFMAYEISDQLDALVYDECREERKQSNGLSDLEEQLEIVQEQLTDLDSFEERRSFLHDVVQRYRNGSGPVDLLRRNLERSLNKDHGLLRLRMVKNAGETAM